MTYLELCQAVVDEVGLSGEITSVLNQRGDFRRIVRFVRTATNQLEGRWINWRFHYGTYAFQTTQGINQYTAPASLSIRQFDPNRAYIDQLQVSTYFADEAIDYNRDPIGEDYEGTPVEIIIERDNTLRFIGTPDRAYNVEIGYYRTATMLNQNTDTPAIPEQFQEIIVQEAIRRYANYDESPELKIQALEQIYGVNGSWALPEPGSWLHQLQADQLPNSYLNGATEGGLFVVRTE